MFASFAAIVPQPASVARFGAQERASSTSGNPYPGRREMFSRFSTCLPRPCGPWVAARNSARCPHRARCTNSALTTTARYRASMSACIDPPSRFISASKIRSADRVARAVAALVPISNAVRSRLPAGPCEAALRSEPPRNGTTAGSPPVAWSRTNSRPPGRWISGLTTLRCPSPSAELAFGSSRVV